MRKLWVTKKEQHWTTEDPSYLHKYLTTGDDEIYEFDINNPGDSFVIVTRNGLTYCVFDYEYQADQFWEDQYKDYHFFTASSNAYYIVDEVGSYYEDLSAAHRDGYWNTIYLHRGESFVGYGGRIVYHGDKDGAYDWMYRHKGYRYRLLK